MQNNEAPFDRYRRNHSVQTDCLKRKTAHFIENHESSTTVQVVRTSEDIPAVLVFSHKEGADETYLYIYDDADFVLGDYFVWNNVYFFSYEQDLIVKEVNYIKYKALECNVFVNDNFWAFFKGTLRATKDVSYSSGAEESAMIPLLIAPRNAELLLGSEIRFGGQTWDIEDGDYYTINGIGYYYLTRGVNSRDEEEIEEEYLEPVYYIGSKIQFSTELGYYQTNLNVKLVERNVSSVTILPLESGELQVTTLEQGSPVIHTLDIKENV